MHELRALTMKTAEQIAHAVFTHLQNRNLLPTWPMSPDDLRQVMTAAIEADRAQRQEAPANLAEEVVGALGYYYGDDSSTARWAAGHHEEVWDKYLEPMLKDIREEH